MTTGTAGTGRIRRAVRRGLAALALVCAAVLGGAVLLAPTAGAAPSATVDIRDLTPPLVSVDPGGSVTFTNRIEPKTVQVGGGGLLPSLVTVQVLTDVTLGLPSGSAPLPKDASVTERFDSTCLTCTITYTYRVVVPDTSVVGNVLNTVTTRALSTLPQNQLVTYDGRQTTVQIGVPTPFLVNTLVPLPDLPSVNLPSLPPVDVPLPSLPSLPAPVPTSPTTAVPTAPAPAAPPASGIDGTGYSYELGGGAAAMAPAGGGAAAFDPSALLPGAAGGTGATGGAAGSGSGGVAGGYDGATVPVFGALDGASLDEESSTVTADAAPTGPALPLPALLAVVALAGATAALVRTHLAVRAR
ncbi:hypothetical protein GCM10027451_14860 [Geodermatophilus aquaeductus]|uniref:Uncharacterized protein n=1 Tax=Geodermatophilus aquaeductus TaxID=1564161 RepID=A0A521BHZ7_9ACTN|nr:hypothetical protein [Geodermatophilus aquaeductus]SMO46713.1 hypothetical protein SAMN06273567_101781 [Geodermatophilus aquaeductus]